MLRSRGKADGVRRPSSSSLTTPDGAEGAAAGTADDAVVRAKSWDNSLGLLVVLFVVKFLESFGYFSISLSLVLHLDSLGFSDVDAGWVFGGVGVSIALIGTLLSPLIDRLGVKWTLVVGASISVVSRFAIVFVSAKTPTLINLLVLFPAGVALGVPVMTIAIRRYSNRHTVVAAFAWFYSVMNASALCSGLVTDLVRHTYRDGTMLLGVKLSALQVLFFTGALAAVLMLIIALFFISEVEINKDGDRVPFKPVDDPVWDRTRQICADRAFWRLVVFSAVVSFARMVFRHLDASFPKYMIRTMGSTTPYGLLYSINPLIVLVAAPTFGEMWKDRSAYTMTTVGTFLTALSVFFLVIGAHYWTAVMFLVVLSVGESLSSPRVYQYSMDLSPPGHEGVYSQLSAAPLFLGKVFAGAMSGGLLDAYCPADPPRTCGMMWFVIGAVALLTPILLVGFRWFIDNPGPAGDAGAGGRDEEEEDGPHKQQHGAARLEEVQTLLVDGKPREGDGEEDDGGGGVVVGGGIGGGGAGSGAQKID